MKYIRKDKPVIFPSRIMADCCKCCEIHQFRKVCKTQGLNRKLKRYVGVCGNEHIVENDNTTNIFILAIDFIKEEFNKILISPDNKIYS